MDDEQSTADKNEEQFVSWQIQQYEKIFNYIKTLLDFDNKIIELPNNHDLNFKTKKGEHIGLKSIKIIELYKYTINKLESDGINNDFIKEVDVLSLLKCLDILLDSGDKIRTKLDDANQYVNQANQALLINVNQLQQKLIDFEKYKDENKEFNQLYKKMDEDFKDFIKKIDFDISEIKRKIDKVKEEKEMEQEEEKVK